MDIPNTWSVLLEQEQRSYYRELTKFVAQERSQTRIYPPETQVYGALQHTPLSKVKVVILGQDPYHGEGQAHGLAFSVPAGVKLPPSLRNIFKELANDVDCDIPRHGCLTSWAKQGVLLLNTVLTVKAGEANSHRKRGWEEFTDRVIDAVNSEARSVVFVLWGKPAQKKKKAIDLSRHMVIESPHPSPLSAHRGFFGSRPFSRINDFLVQHGESAIKWGSVLSES